MKYLMLLFFLTVCTVSIVNSDVSAEQKKEVTHLLNFIKNSGCIINRNGTVHTAEKGLKHIQKKYDYYRDDINNTEDFIRLAATKSIMSGDYYRVKCPGKAAIKTQDWLLTELNLFRLKTK